MRCHRAAGFTLIEMIAIILIIALLFAIAIPLLRYAKESAKRTACAHNLSAIGKAMFMYADVPANGTFPNNGKNGDPFADDKPMRSLALFYKAYIMDPRVFSCPSMPIPPSMVSSYKPSSPRPSEMDAADFSYGYDPGHGPNDAVAAILADKKGAGQNSDNHGPNAGQNVALGSGVVEFHDSPVNVLDDKGLKDDDIFGLNPVIPRNMDGYIRQ